MLNPTYNDASNVITNKCNRHQPTSCGGVARQRSALEAVICLVQEWKASFESSKANLHEPACPESANR